MSYRPRTSPLHAARAAAGIGYCMALALVALVVEHPLALAALVLALLGAGAAAGVGPELRRAALLAVLLAALIVVINALVVRDGLTVIVRLGELPVVGHTDVTLEATAYGGVLGLRAMALILCGVLYTTAVDPDEVLRLFRRVSFRSALTATLATRMVPVLARDARRLGDAQRCRTGSPPSRVQLLRAASSGALERALDVAAALEVRGYGARRRPPRSRLPYAIVDFAFLATAAVLVVLAAAVRSAGLMRFRPYPSLDAALGSVQIAVAVSIVAIAILPFTVRRGLER